MQSKKWAASVLEKSRTRFLSDVLEHFHLPPTNAASVQSCPFWGCRGQTVVETKKEEEEGRLTFFPSTTTTTGNHLWCCQKNVADTAAG